MKGIHTLLTRIGMKSFEIVWTLTSWCFEIFLCKFALRRNLKIEFVFSIVEYAKNKAELDVKRENSVGLSLLKQTKVQRSRRLSQLAIFVQPRAENSPVVLRSEAKEKENAQRITMTNTLRNFDSLIWWSCITFKGPHVWMLESNPNGRQLLHDTQNHVYNYILY